MAEYPSYNPEIVLITGATGDFGKAFAARFAAIGSKLILHGRDKEKTESLCAQYPNAHPIVFDMTDKTAMKNAIASLPADFKNIDLLVNNAGLALGLDKAQDADPDDWERMIDVDVKALTLMTSLVLKGMTERKRGHIVNIGSTAGNYAYMGGNVYGAAKAFVKQFSLNLRADLVGTKVRVTNVEPGQVETQFSTVRFKGDTDKAKAVYAGAQSLTAEDVAETVFWAATLPAHFNVNRVEIMPTCQSFAGLSVERTGS
ncbi:MAG: NAD(P)-dependent oxidoreductase [Micavibrio aeruginosavorus]|uniref:NAD(P)-dependent oxidoreductase n=1 Tax=Micavibrio aeruginosavorus TaxID=349221 RepID=A0A2W5N6S3_9BACT|nr:MAG: NAD(P)-dependent oxidoreductase [Micavibrio aeruginosavorus]